MYTTIGLTNKQTRIIGLIDYNNLLQYVVVVSLPRDKPVMLCFHVAGKAVQVQRYGGQTRWKICCRQMSFAGSGSPGRDITSPVERGTFLVMTSFLVTPTLRRQQSTSWVLHLLKNSHPPGFYQSNTTPLVFGFPCTLIYSFIFTPRTLRP